MAFGSDLTQNSPGSTPEELLVSLEVFLGSIDLNAYREAYAGLKIVEMDLPRNIHALKSIYHVYWNTQQFLNFDNYYEIYLNSVSSEAELFRIKSTMCADCYYRGLKARIYRTWASLLTQIYGGYVAQTVFGSGTVAMSEELDHNNIDIQVTYARKVINYQVKKESHRPEARGRIGSSRINEGINIDLYYFVPPRNIFENPLRQNGQPRAAYARFVENTDLWRLENGFVLFHKSVFERSKAEIDSQIQNSLESGSTLAI